MDSENDSEKKILVIDDLRTYVPGSTEWVFHARTVELGDRMLWCYAPWHAVMLDHDMGAGATTRPIVDALAEAVYWDEWIPDVTEWYVQSINPVGAAYLMQSLDRLGFRPRRIYLPG